MADYGKSNFPRQKKPTKSKGKKWGKQNIDAGERMAIHGDEGVRRSYYNKRVNYNLYNDILDQSDVEKTTNPHGIKGFHAPAKMQNYPITNPKIDVLLGEEKKRGFDYRVRVADGNSISSKEKQKQDAVRNLIVEEIKEETSDPQELKKKLRDQKKYLDYNFQDAKERRANQILQYLEKNLKLDLKFNDGFKDALIAGEEIYQCDIVAGEPTLEKLNPMNVHTVRSGESNKIEDSDIIIIDGYRSPGMVIDEYHDWLKDSEIEQIENQYISGTSAQGGGIDIGEQYANIMLDDVIDTAQFRYDESNFGTSIDHEGNIRVLKVYWKSLRKVHKLRYFDRFGDEQLDIVNEYYKPNEKRNEEIVKTLWINEWWEGHKIGGGKDKDGIYTKIQPRPVQFRSLENPSKCHPGIVGTVYNTNDNEAVSMMDRLKPFQYFYNVLMYRTELAFAKSHGKIMRMPLHEIPEGWDVDKWLSYAYSMNIAPVDMFKEGNKGAAQGTLAGNMQQNDHIIDMEMGNYIQQHVSILQYVEQQIGSISGVSEQREGQIDPRETSGNANQAIIKSSHITEFYFAHHDDTKVRALQVLLETAKAAWRGKNKKVQFVLDDLSTQMFDVDGDEFAETEYGLYISDSGKDQELLRELKELAHAGLQNEMIDFSTIMDIYTTESISSIKNKIEDAEEKREEERDADRQQKMKEMKAQKQFEREDKMLDHKLSKYETDKQAAIDREKMVNDRYIAMIKEQGSAARDDMSKGSDEKIKLQDVVNEQQKLQNEFQTKQRELGIKEEELELEKEQNRIEEKKINSETYNS